MNALTPERIAEIRAMPHDNWRIVHELLDALESSRAEVQRLQLERDAAIDERNAWRSGDQDSRIEADRLRGEVQRLTEEVRRLREIAVSDEVRGLLTAHGSDGTVLVCGEFASGREFVEKYRVSRRSDAGRVVVPREEWEAFVSLEEQMRRGTAYLNLREQACLDALDALRSSTSHDSRETP